MKNLEYAPNPFTGKLTGYIFKSISVSDGAKKFLRSELISFIERENEVADELQFEEDRDAESQEDYKSNNPTALRLEIEKNY